MKDIIHILIQFVKDYWQIIVSVVAGGFTLGQLLYQRRQRRKVKLELSNSRESNSILLSNEGETTVYVESVGYLMREFTVPKKLAETQRAMSQIGKTIRPGEQITLLEPNMELLKSMERLNKHQIESLKNYPDVVFNVEQYTFIVFCDFHVRYKRTNSKKFRQYVMNRVMQLRSNPSQIWIQYPFEWPRVSLLKKLKGKPTKLASVK